MAVELTLGSETFNYPDAGDKSGWGEDATDWAEKATELIGEFFGPNDVPLITATIADNQSGAFGTFTQSIKGLKFDTTKVQKVIVDYLVTRTDGGTTSTEYGTMNAAYDGSSWTLQVEHAGDAGMAYNVDATGQFQYKSSSIGGTYSGSIKFRAKTIDLT